MRRFKEFLKISEAGNMGINPTLTAGPAWEFPYQQQQIMPSSLQGWATKMNMLEKPEFALLDKAYRLVQQIASSPELYGFPNNPAVISGTPQNNGTITNLNYNNMVTTGAGKGMKFLPAEFNHAVKLGIFQQQGTMVTINLGTLYSKAKAEVARDHGLEAAARGTDQMFNLANSPGNGSQALQRNQV